MRAQKSAGAESRRGASAVVAQAKGSVQESMTSANGPAPQANPAAAQGRLRSDTIAPSGRTFEATGNNVATESAL